MIKKVHEPKEDGTERKPHEIEIDNIAYALLLKVNDRKIIFASDGKEECWNDIFENCTDDINDCSILKAGHHGHESGFHKEAVEHMNPKYIVFSNSKDEDDSNGAESKYNEVVPNAIIYKTCDEGTIIANCPFDANEEITFSRA